MHHVPRLECRWAEWTATTSDFSSSARGISSTRSSCSITLRTRSGNGVVPCPLGKRHPVARDVFGVTMVMLVTDELLPFETAIARARDEEREKQREHEAGWALQARRRHEEQARDATFVQELQRFTEQFVAVAKPLVQPEPFCSVRWGPVTTGNKAKRFHRPRTGTVRGLITEPLGEGWSFAVSPQGPPRYMPFVSTKRVYEGMDDYGHNAVLSWHLNLMTVQCDGKARFTVRFLETSVQPSQQFDASTRWGVVAASTDTAPTPSPHVGKLIRSIVEVEEHFGLAPIRHVVSLRGYPDEYEPSEEWERRREATRAETLVAIVRGANVYLRANGVPPLN